MTNIPLGRALPRASSEPYPKAGASRPTPRLATETPSYLLLHRVGFALPPWLPRTRCALTAPFHPCHARLAAPFGGLFSVALSRGSPRPVVDRHPALWCPDFPRRTRVPTRSSGRLRRGGSNTRGWGRQTTPPRQCATKDSGETAVSRKGREDLSVAGDEPGTPSSSATAHELAVVGGAPGVAPRARAPRATGRRSAGPASHFRVAHGEQRGVQGEHAAPHPRRQHVAELGPREERSRPPRVARKHPLRDGGLLAREQEVQSTLVVDDDHGRPCRFARSISSSVIRTRLAAIRRPQRADLRQLRLDVDRCVRRTTLPGSR